MSGSGELPAKSLQTQNGVTENFFVLPDSRRVSYKDFSEFPESIVWRFSRTEHYCRSRRDPNTFHVVTSVSVTLE